MSKYTLIDGTASIEGELSLLAEKEYRMPLSKKDTTESLKTALYELLTYADSVKSQNKSTILLAKKHMEQNKTYESTIDALYVALKDLLASISGGKKSCGHEFTCVCAGDAARKMINQMEDE